MQNGLYAVQFTAMGNVGGGVVTVRDGKVGGGDAGFAYIGTISETGSDVTGKLEVFQHDASVPSVFAGLKQFTLDVKGDIIAGGNELMLDATSPAAPGVTMKIAMRLLRAA